MDEVSYGRALCAIICLFEVHVQQCVGIALFSGPLFEGKQYINNRILYSVLRVVFHFLCRVHNKLDHCTHISTLGHFGLIHRTWTYP